DARTPEFAAQFAALIDAKRETDEDVARAVASIVDDVRARGDQAVIELSARLDRVALTADTLRVTDDDIERAHREAPADVKDARCFAASQIESYHRRQLPLDESF